MKKRIIRQGSLFIYLIFISLNTTGKLLAQADTKKAITTIIDREYKPLENLYKYLHQHPELSLEEEETSKILARELEVVGCSVTTGIGGYGVVGVMKNGPGPVIMIRTDMDALPMREHTGVEFASNKTIKNKNGEDISLMHACGHDLHMSSWVGVSKVLNELRKEWKGTVVFVGQPAEENGQGARSMLSAGLFTRFPKPDYALAIHVNSALESGKVGLCFGHALANIDVIDITVKGKGGHGAVPQLTIDPIVLASKMILGFQTIISREISPQKSALISVGSIHGGTNANIIPDKVTLKLSVRSFDDEVQKSLIEKIMRTCEGIAFTAGLEPEDYPIIEIRNEYTPAVYNEPELTSKISNHFKQILGPENVLTLTPEMFGEDFGWYHRENPSIPTLIYSVGSVHPQKMAEALKSNKTLPSTHSSLYLPDLEPSLKMGILSMSAAVLHLLPN
ncbi:amidohydrolase [Dyadobacter tibetensis]|uniref:amidohydrolase n=1 Tax=Dyadobacter tibetensis TaxID=1211851 RepID=UPI00046FACD2|nr:amidohydrolase [Dyadobacter tibetensis]